MNKLLRKGTLFLLMMITTFILIFSYITIILPPQFNNSYQYVINDKYANLIRMKSPKIVFIAGSSGAFGLNADLIKKETGLECANLGLHAGFGMKFQTEIAKGNISKGDIVIIAYEDNAWESSTLDAALVVTALDNNINEYKYIPKENYINIIKYLPTYFFKKLDTAFVTPVQASGVYSRSSFDIYGNMTLNRSECTLPTPIPETPYGRLKLEKSLINNEMVNYVNEFNKYVTQRGATLVISFSPVVNEIVVSNKDEISGFQSSLVEKLNAPIISNINDYIFERKYIYDSPYHTNNTGELRRTKLLIKDLNEFRANNL